MTHRALSSIVLTAASTLLIACGDDTTSSTAGSTGTPTTSATSSGSGGEGGSGGSGGEGGKGGKGGSGGFGGSGGGGGSGGVGGSGGEGGSGAVCGNGTLEATEACDDGNITPGDGCDDFCVIEVGWSCAGQPSVCSTTCGDGILAGTEECDDTNTAPFDGCDDACLVETGYTCLEEPSVCSTTCGDGILAGTEACDDLNTTSLDGCSDVCLVEAGYSCAGEPSACSTVCGDGILAGTEQCDDFNAAPLDGCSDVCLVEAGYSCTGEPSACSTVCGDGILAGTEACDDLNTTSLDGCSDVCLVEAGYSCAGAPSTCSTTCGDGILAGTEQCDDLNTAPLDGCSDTCLVEAGYSCAGAPSSCSAICGDGILVGAESCDDFNVTPLDGCSDACVIEPGFVCMGAPSACVAICGDGIVTATELCDDFNAVPGDGCSACAPDPGYVCAGQPSSCSTVCGDGIVAGTEECDDGNPTNGDGCSTSCTANTGESCTDPLVMSQATTAGGVHTWFIPAGSVTTADGAFTCDTSGSGTDVVIHYTKTSPDLAGGGNLLHIKADTSETATAYYLNVEVLGGACSAPSGTELKCLWYKHDWDTFLDVPAGDYYIWVAKNVVTNPFPATTVTIEEIPAADAEGEGCFAPYTIASAIYTPPAVQGEPHTWTLPPSINSFDMGATWGEPGSISCDNTEPYGDIHGVDAVIAFDKLSATSVLKVDVQNLDPTLSTSDLNVEVLSACDPAGPMTTSRTCRADGDAFSVTAPSPAGPVYVWVTTEATSEEFDGAQVQITEIFPGLGESWPTAEPIASGTTALAPTSAMRLDAPSCFPAVENVHWYAYTLSSDAAVISTPGAGVVGVYGADGQQLACVTDASVSPVGLPLGPGATIYIAVTSPTLLASISISDVPYSGVLGPGADLGITFPTSALTDYGMTVGASEIYLGGTTKVFSFPKTGNATALEFGAAQGLTTTHLGYDLAFGGGALFSVDSTTSTSASRLFRIFDGATWGPTAWDLVPTYPASSPSHAITYDGSILLMATRRTTTNANFYSFPVGASSSPTLLGTNAGVWYVVGIAADDTFIYVAGNGTLGEGVYRLERANIAVAPVKIASLDIDTLSGAIEVDADVAPVNLYVRDALGDVHAVVQPGGPGTAHIGVISSLGTTNDYAMTFDKATGRLYLFETETDSTGVIRELQ